MGRIGGAAIFVMAGMVTTAAAQAPRKLILFHADGAGTAHWSVARQAVGELAVDRFQALGLSDTRGADHIVTESAAGATALATGVRSFMGALGVGPDSQPRETVLEAAQARQMATGLVTTTYIVDATPAAFYSHSPSRRDWGTIIGHLVQRRPNVLIGGGRELFEQMMTSDSVGLLDALRHIYTVVVSGPDLAALDPNTVTNLMALLAAHDLPLAGAREPSLARLTEIALTMLDKNPNGFFLLVENEETDTQAHDNADYAVIAAEMRAFDEAICVAVSYQERHPETLIVVAADHETGGMILATDSLGGPQVAYVTLGHTGEMVPVFANGPGAERFRGLLRNEEVGQAMLEWIRGR